MAVFAVSLMAQTTVTLTVTLSEEHVWALSQDWWTTAMPGWTRTASPRHAHEVAVVPNKRQGSNSKGRQPAR